MGSVHALPRRDAAPTLADAAEAFVSTIPTPATRRAYAAALDGLRRVYGDTASLAELADRDRLAEVFTDLYGTKAPRTWNARLGALHAAVSYWRAQGWLLEDPCTRLTTRQAQRDRTRALSREQVQALLGDSDAHTVDRALWSMLYDTAARAAEVLALNVEDLDGRNRTTRVRRKGGAMDAIVWKTKTARLLPLVVDGRRSGPLFLTPHRAAATRGRRTPASADVDPTTGRGRMSYRWAAARLAERSQTVLGQRVTLHQFRHSALTHAAGDGAPTHLLKALSGHSSTRSLDFYIQAGTEDLQRWQAEHDPAARPCGSGCR